MKNRKIPILYGFIFFILTIRISGQMVKDPFHEMLNRLEISEANLGFRPKGYWIRYPDPKDIPYKQLAFNDLFAEPQRIHDFVGTMALSVEDYLHAEYLAANSNALLQIAYFCGVRHQSAQFRPYSASLWAELDEKEPLLMAVREIYLETHRVYRYNAMGDASDFPLIEKDLMAAINPVHPDIQKEIARTVLNLLEAYRFRQIAMRNVDMMDALNVWRIRRLGETQFDGLEYYPAMEDCAKNLDFNSLYYAGYKLIESGERLADALVQIRGDKSIDWKNQNLNIMTPIGRIVLGGTGKDFHHYSDALLVVDLGGNDIYQGAAGSTPSLDIPISLTIDLDGSDTYINEDEFLPSQGSAVFGAAMLLDLAGRDRYRSTRLAQGAAIFGIGILADMDGNDEYDMWTSGQGGSYFGVGLLIDRSGDDLFNMWGDGQGYGGIGGVGTLVDYSGDDHYWTEPLSSNVYRPDYHSKEGKLNYSYSQGCGVGRRGDITDGHSWAGGMGTLIDISGDDLYESANWSLGCGYWYGMGFCWDGGGNDTYKSASWSQGSGAHFCIGALFDKGGNDKHILWEEQSVGLSFAHDYTISILLNQGGDDWYQLKDDGLSYAINMSQAFFFDTDGNDTYITGGRGQNYGSCNFQANNPPAVTAFYHLYSDQISLFADINGQDRYKIREYTTGIETPEERMDNGKERFVPENRKDLANPRHYGMAKDFENWTGPEIGMFRDKMKKRY